MIATLTIFAISMLIFGSLNTLTTKLQDITVVGHTATGKPLTFSHPAFQSACMFLGEFACLLPYFCTYLRSKPNNPEGEAPRFRHETWGHKLKALAAFALPALCDSAATTLLNIGLILTYASVFQMLRGTMVIFTGVLTVVLLKRRLHIHHWLGIVLITAGAAIVGACSVIYSGQQLHDPLKDGGLHQSWTPRHLLMLEDRKGTPDAASAPLLGDLLIVGAQVLQASQFIVEEKYLSQYRVPALLAVGLEGFWGLVICSIALPVLSMVHGSNGPPLDSFPAAIQEISHSKTLFWSTIGSLVSIAFFNFFGISVTKKLSGASRATIDACRTVLVWMFSLWIGWEQFHGLQVLGFLVILSGSTLYNELIRAFLPKSAVEEADIEEPLLDEQQHQSATLPPLPPLPLPPGGRTTPHQARPRSIRQPQYTLARSMRMGPAALSPHSLTSPAHSASELLEEDSTGSC